METAPTPQKPYEEAIEKVIARLRRAELPPNVCNIYRDDDPNLDLRGGAAKRRENLRRYLKALRDARWLLVGLAPGWRGARFTGVPFTDEHRLCFPGSCYDRTGKHERPMREATAGVVMDLLGARTDVACWNVCPWHPHETGNPLSNADPDAGTLAPGLEVMEALLARLFPNAQLIAVGRVAAEALRELKINGRPASLVAEVRHPAHGGAEEFRAQAGRLLGIESQPEA
ncbi:MAG: uracil-DNA glycosylase [Planctomycetes bacterium]|jgi:uracil-DNA glycosylase|nr:uracil-DNA glycosylase [Planctomycetota bacterium]MCL4729517.1 uracil-DNA glycosylase [Planctomycetota bacterium]